MAHLISWQLKTNQYKGQLHCHTTNSDGAHSPTVLLEAYRDAGYDFVCITDHAFLTTQQNVSDIVHIPSVEETLGAVNWSDGKHLLNINATNVRGYPNYVDTQTTINNIIADGGMAGLAHPLWQDPESHAYNWNNDAIDGVVGFEFMEIVNTVLWARGLKTLAQVTYTEQYDHALSTGKKCWCLAVDDMHIIGEGDLDKGWVVVNANSNSQSDILDALKTGNFYSSIGGVISDITLNVNTITISVPVSSTIKWIKKNGEVIKTTTGVLEDNYTVQGDELYVRMEVDSGTDNLAWSQPLFITPIDLQKAQAVEKIGGVITPIQSQFVKSNGAIISSQGYVGVGEI